MERKEGGDDMLGNVENNMSENKLLRKRSKLREEITKEELLKRIENLEAGKGVFLTDEEFEKQSEED